MNDLQYTDLGVDDRLNAVPRRAPAIFFPETSVVSTMYEANGLMIEVRGVGYEGIVGFHTINLGSSVNYSDVCKIAGSIAYMDAAVYQQHLADNEKLQRLHSVHITAILCDLAQSSVCHGLHSIAQRCARCLLTTADRVGGDSFLLTHELPAEILGVRRPGVTLAVQRLHKLGAIEYHFGRMTIVDRAILENEACECYRIVALETERLFTASRKAQRSSHAR